MISFGKLSRLMSGEFMVWESGLFVVAANRSVFKNVFIYLSRYLVGLAAELYSHFSLYYGISSGIFLPVIQTYLL